MPGQRVGRIVADPSDIYDLGWHFRPIAFYIVLLMEGNVKRQRPAHVRRRSYSEQVVY